MKQITVYRFRKCSDIEMEYPYVEILDQNDTAFMDISRSDDGEFRALFYPEIVLQWITINALENIIEVAKKELQ